MESLNRVDDRVWESNCDWLQNLKGLISPELIFGNHVTSWTNGAICGPDDNYLCRGQLLVRLNLFNIPISCYKTIYFNNIRIKILFGIEKMWENSNESHLCTNLRLYLYRLLQKDVDGRTAVVRVRTTRRRISSNVWII